MHIVASPLRLGPASTTPASPVPLGSSRFVPSPSPSAVKRNFLLCPIRNLSLCRDRREPGGLTFPFVCDQVAQMENLLMVAAVLALAAGIAMIDACKPASEPSKPKTPDVATGTRVNPK